MKKLNKKQRGDEEQLNEMWETLSTHFTEKLAKVVRSDVCCKVFLSQNILFIGLFNSFPEDVLSLGCSFLTTCACVC